MPTPRESGANLYRREYDLDAPQGSQRPVVRLCDVALTEGILNGADAIRFQVVDKDRGGVEYEIGGAWRQVMQVPLPAFAPLINRLKLMAALDIARRPSQDGELHVRFKGLPHRFAIHVEQSGTCADLVSLRRTNASAT